MQNNLKNEAIDKRMAAHVPCIKIETKKCKNSFRKDIQSVKIYQKWPEANPVLPFLQNIFRRSPLFIPFSNAP